MKIKIPALIWILALFISCSKDKSNPTPPPSSDTYLTTTSGSIWNYHEVDSSGTSPVISDYVLTATGNDTTINSKSYSVFKNTGSSNEYFTISGNDYYQFDTLPAAIGSVNFERLYLKDNANVNDTWSQNLSVSVSGISIPITITNKIAEQNISRTVNGNSYTNVIHVSTTISSSLIPSASLVTNIDSYYAKKYGLIENKTIISLNYLTLVANVNVLTTLTSAQLK